MTFADLILVLMIFTHPGWAMALAGVICFSGVLACIGNREGAGRSKSGPVPWPEPYDGNGNVWVMSIIWIVLGVLILFAAFCCAADLWALAHGENIGWTH
jgi:hypothetical protein